MSCANDYLLHIGKLMRRVKLRICISVLLYSELNYQCEKGFDPVCTSALEPVNENKNPIKDILPCESNRVVLDSSHWPGDFINVTFLDIGEIILTINPTGNTVRDFNQLI